MPRNKRQKPAAEKRDIPRSEQINLRIPAEYAWLIPAVDAYADREERSRNQVIVMLLRDAMVERGFGATK